MTSAHGTLHENDGRQVLRFEREIQRPVERVWTAISDSEELAEWYPALQERELEVGATITFIFPSEDLPPTEGEITALDPPHLLEHTWDTDTLRWELSARGEGCLLTFTNVFDERSKAARDAAGWHVCLDVLTAVVEETLIDWSEDDRWTEVHSQYLARFEIDLREEPAPFQ